MKQTAWGLVMATGKSEQLSAEIETAFLYLNDRPVLAYSLAAFMQCPDISGIVVVVSRERAESVLGMVQMFGFSKVRKIVVGGARRAASMAASSTAWSPIWLASSSTRRAFTARLSSSVRPLWASIKAS